MEILLLSCLLPIFSYFFAHRMPNKRWLSTYSFFWLGVVGLLFYDFMVNASPSNNDSDQSLGWFLLVGVLGWSCILAFTGIIGRAIVLYLRHQGKDVKMLTVNFLSFFALITFPTLIYLLILIIHVFPI